MSLAPLPTGARNKANGFFAKGSHRKLAKADASKAAFASGAFSIEDVFSQSQDGVRLELLDYDTLRQDAGGTGAVTTGDPVGYAADQSGNDNHATQAVSAARGTASLTGLAFDLVDDALEVTVPAGGWTGSMALATDYGYAVYGVDLPAGTWEIGGDYFPGAKLIHLTARDGAFSGAENSGFEAYMAALNGVGTFQSLADFSNAWREMDWLTAFPLIDTSSGTNFGSSWRDCSSLTSFPAINTSSGTNFSATWRNCSSLTSFPAINTSSGTNFDSAWRNCTSLTSFPANVFDSCPGKEFPNAFANTALTEASIDNILTSINTANTSNGTFGQSGGTAPSATGEAAIDAMRARGWAVTVTGGY